jgi:hypothetical protein
LVNVSAICVWPGTMPSDLFTVTLPGNFNGLMVQYAATAHRPRRPCPLIGGMLCKIRKSNVSENLARGHSSLSDPDEQTILAVFEAISSAGLPSSFAASAGFRTTRQTVSVLRRPRGPRSQASSHAKPRSLSFFSVPNAIIRPPAWLSRAPRTCGQARRSRPNFDLIPTSTSSHCGRLST